MPGPRLLTPRTRHRRGVLTDRGRAMLAAGTTLGICGTALGFDDLVRIGLLALLLPVLSLLVARRGGARLEAARTAYPATLTAGREATIRIRLRNTGDRPSPVLFAEENVAPTLGPRCRFVLPVTRAGGHADLVYAVRPVRRGRQVAGPLQVCRRDVFGLAATSFVVPGELELVALPAVHPLAGTVSPFGPGNDGSTPTLMSLHGDDDSSLRSYQQGDDLRRIHWPVTAHRGELMVRHEGRPTLRRAVLLAGPFSAAGRPGAPGFAGDRNAAGPPEASPAMDWVIDALASVAAHLAGSGYALHVVTPGSVRSGAAPSADTPAAGLTALALVDADPAGGPAIDPARVIEVARELGSTGGVLVTAVSDADESVVHQVLSAKTAAVSGLLFVVDTGAPATLGGSPTRADQVAALARSGGWRAVVARPGDRVDERWAAMFADQRVGVPQ